MPARSTITGAILLAVGACGGGSPGNNSGVTENLANVAAPSNEQQAIRALPDDRRNDRMIEAIRAAGFACQRVQESPLSQTPNATPVFMATCDDRAVYAVAVRDDGSMVVKEAMREKGE